jgi:hypothetical protein
LQFKASPRQIVLETLSGKNSSQKRAGGVAKGIDLYCKTCQEDRKAKKRIAINIDTASRTRYKFISFTSLQQPYESSAIINHLFSLQIKKPRD